MDGVKPDKCFTCGCSKFCWTKEKGWACLRCDPPLPGISELLRNPRDHHAPEEPDTAEEGPHK